MKPVDLCLDLRGLVSAPADPAAWRALWTDRIEPILRGKVLAPPRAYRLTFPDGSGTVVLDVRSAPPTALTADEPYSLRGLYERPRWAEVCVTCGAARGAHGCEGCRRLGRPAGYCDRHAVFLDGRIEATCEEHRPACRDCQVPATFWCDGGCHRAACEAHRLRHPDDPDRSFCPTCHEERFAPCSEPGCGHLGTHRCEWFDPATLAMCGRRVCRRHLRQWAVYPPEMVGDTPVWREEGLGRCPVHRPALPRDGAEIVRQILLGTASRQLRRGSENGPQLPRLLPTRHTALNTLGATPTFRAVHDWWQAAETGLTGSAPVVTRARRLLPGHTRIIAEDLARIERERTPVMAEQLAVLRSALLTRGQPDLAAAVQATDWNERQNRLYVVLPEALAGRLVGHRGENVTALSVSVGFDIALEKGLRRSR